MEKVSGERYQGVFKKRGALELELGAEPLPPTRITREAQRKLEAWGFTPEDVLDLRGFTSQFRYDFCREKVARISEKPIEVFSLEGIEYVNLPVFYDINGRLDGQCGDIGKQWIIQINKSGLIERLNRRERNNRVVTAFYRGLSETHFCREGANHIWNGLALLDKNGYIIDEIYFDAAFQIIEYREESRYIPRTATYSPVNITLSENIRVPVGWVEIEGHTWVGSFPGFVVLGVSSDYKFAYALAFPRDRRTDAIRPVLDEIPEDGSHNPYIIGDEDQVMAPNGNTISSSDHKEEIVQILREAQKFTFVERPPTENQVTWSKYDIGG